MIVRFLKDFWLGLRAYYEALVMVFQYNLWLFFLIPVALSVSMFFGGEYLLDQLKQVNIEHEIDRINFENELNEISFKGFPKDAAEMKLLVIGLQIIFVVISLRLRKYVILILLAPVMAILSTKTEKLLTGNKYPFSFDRWVSDIYRGINFALRNMFRQMIILAAWYVIVLLIPELDFLSFWVIFGVGSYYYGASLMDYTNERMRMSMEESVRFIRKNSGLALSLGTVFSILFFTDYIGIVLAPIVGVIAATYAIDYKVDLKKNKYAKKS